MKTVEECAELIQNVVDWALTEENSHCILALSPYYMELQYEILVPFTSNVKKIVKEEEANKRTVVGTIDLGKDVGPQIKKAAKKLSRNWDKYERSRGR